MPKQRAMMCVLHLPQQHIDVLLQVEFNETSSHVPRSKQATWSEGALAVLFTQQVGERAHIQSGSQATQCTRRSC